MSERRYAGFWIRVGATIIDTIVILLVTGPPLWMIYGQEYWTGTQMFYGIWDVLLAYVLPIAATIWFWLKYKATPGKMLTGLIVVDELSGRKMTVGQAIGRYFSYIVAILPLGLGFIWVAFDKKKQGWHDKLASTVVIKED